MLQLLQYRVGRAAGTGWHVAESELNGVPIVTGVFIAADDLSRNGLQAVIVTGQIQQQALAGLEFYVTEHGQAADGKVADGGRLGFLWASKPVEQTKFEF